MTRSRPRKASSECGQVHWAASLSPITFEGSSKAETANYNVPATSKGRSVETVPLHTQSIVVEWSDVPCAVSLSVVRINKVRQWKYQWPGHSYQHSAAYWSVFLRSTISQAEYRLLSNKDYLADRLKTTHYKYDTDQVVGLVPPNKDGEGVD